MKSYFIFKKFYQISYVQEYAVGVEIEHMINFTQNKMSTARRNHKIGVKLKDKYSDLSNSFKK